jgi:DNA-binding NarL/FixJ family response regulator
VHADHQQVWAAMQAGAGGYLIKDDDPDQLADAIRTVHAGHVAITPELAFVISLSPPVLSPTEHQVLLLRSRGHTYEAIAHRLNVDKSTVATLLRRAGEKFAKRAAATAAEARGVPGV